MSTLDQQKLELVEQLAELIDGAQNEAELIDAQNFFNNGMNALRAALKSPPKPATPAPAPAPAPEPEPAVEDEEVDEDPLD